MIQFIDYYYERIQWFILIAGLIVLFFLKEYITIPILFYLSLRAVKHRKIIKDNLAKMSMKEKLVHGIEFILIIALLTVILINTLGSLNDIGVPIWLLYVYVFLVMNIILAGYVYILKKMWKKI
ncbi:putative membrane protein [Bacillus pakistanensis]|uniref:Membrane protein n=1 Tax=Rossellomorea pakistanensis TaxID=992288 RepID=A0ABS2N6M3_9BACI|nr:hypothetical protein [Bacillus pakistanensis]MBM7583506.1 putative membrane protein [Bacillus pakistanensis]